ncbi:MAG TPA: YdcH family protein [Sphingomonas sp.]|nr:YdcH family protein [Sphingomonas sp.]
MNALVERLIATHRQLNREIRRELNHRMPDHFRVTRLKKQRLAVKDQLFRHVPDAAEMRRAARRLLARFRPRRLVQAGG